MASNKVDYSITHRSKDVCQYQALICRALMQQYFRHLGRIHFWELRADGRDIQAFRPPGQVMDRLSCMRRCVACPRPRPIDACHVGTLPLAGTACGNTYVCRYFVNVAFKAHAAILGIHVRSGGDGLTESHRGPALQRM